MYGGDTWTQHLGVTPRAGVFMSINGALNACALHPSLYQRWLYAFIGLPSVLVWAVVLFLLWRLVAAASRHGPFTLPAAAGRRRLGWLIIIGSLAAASPSGA